MSQYAFIISIQFDEDSPSLTASIHESAEEAVNELINYVKENKLAPAKNLVALDRKNYIQTVEYINDLVTANYEQEHFFNIHPLS